METPLPPKDCQCLLKGARLALQAAVEGRSLPTGESVGASDLLKRRGASFVTLTKAGVLRGCIGGLQASVPLAEDVIQHAAAAAMEDYRFPPVQPEELEDIRIEISVLTAPAPLAYADADDLLARLRPHVDGVILIAGRHRATFLPQVWEKISRPEAFLDRLCEKAGLPARSWQHGDVEILTYQVESFAEPET